MSIESEIKKNNMKVFRRIYVKRRETSGDYESTWQRIEDKYIKKFGSVEVGVDDIKINFYKTSGFDFVVQNTDGKFAAETDDKSLWYGYMSQYRTLVKVEAGYTADDGTEYPTTPTLYVGLTDENIVYQEDNSLTIRTNHLSKVFEEFPATDIKNLGTTQTASQIIGRIRDHTDGLGNAIFQKYITSGGWLISATTTYYNPATTTTFDGLSCWELMIKLAEAEDMLLYIDRVGDLHFETKTATSATPIYTFNGLNSTSRTFGANIIGKISIDNNIKNVYNYIRVKHDTEDTSISYYTKKETWNWGDSSSSFKYGVRTYEYENELLTTVTAQTIADALFTKYSFPKALVKFDSKFVPHLDIYDYVTANYKTVSKAGAYIWGHFLYGHGYWGRRSGYNINIDDGDYYIESLKHDLDSFKTSVTLREK